MTRALHPDTRVQRAANREIEPKSRRRRGYEERDAPAAKVVAGVGGFLGLLALGVALPAMLIPALDRTLPLKQARSERPVFPQASLPPLLSAPIAHRRRLEAEANAHLKPARVERAMEQVERKGIGR